MDLKAYQAQIRELTALRHSHNFNELLDKILFGESNSVKFLIKMEINRLTEPCLRIIDLRDKIIEPCQLFERDNIKHYLTQETISVLEDNIKLYGLYTIGAFEAVHQYVIKQKAQQLIQAQHQLKMANVVKKEQCEFLALAQKNKRTSPRMFYVSDVVLTSHNGEIFNAQTANISANGVKIKLKDNFQFSPRSLVTILFTGLTLEYREPILKQPVTYRLIKQEIESDNGSYLYLNDHNDNQEFTFFLGEFIRQNQYKYKLDVHYYYQLAKVKALKNSYLAQMNSLPIYLNEHAFKPFLFALESQINKQIIKDWSCNGTNQLTLLFSELRLCKLLAQIKKSKFTTIYTFVHEVRGKQYFLSATEEELAEKSLKKLFMRIGRTKKSWHVYHLTLTPFQYQPLKNSDITEPVPATFKEITHVATLQHLTKTGSVAMNLASDSTDVSQLNQFIHRPASDNGPTPIFSLLSSESRKEERYQFKSALSISNKKSQYSGQLLDFSGSGLKIKLDQISAFALSEKVSVNLTDLQKLSKTYRLSGLQYKTVHKSAGNILHLQVCDKKTLDICQPFFSKLVKNNAKHFKCKPLQTKKQPFQKKLLEIVDESFLNAVFFISTEHGRPTIKYSAIDIADHPLHTLFSLYSDNNQQLNYYPLANNNVYNRLVLAPFKENREKEAFVYIKAVKGDMQQWEINSFLEEDFSSDQAKLAFIKESQRDARFYALHFRLSRLPKVNLKGIQAEILDISRFAMHLTKKLEEELVTVEGMIEITDRTADILAMANQCTLDAECLTTS